MGTLNREELDIQSKYKTSKLMLKRYSKFKEEGKVTTIIEIVTKMVFFFHKMLMVIENKVNTISPMLELK